jgi:signal peptidase I
MREKGNKTMDAAKVGTLAEIAPSVETQVQRPQWERYCFGTNPVKTFKRVLIWCGVVLFFFNNFLVPIQIIGSSMSPTYSDGSYNFVNKLSYSRIPPHREDVVAVEAEGELLLKRIVALPGERVAIHAGVLQVNERPLHDDFANRPIPWEMRSMKLGPEEYFVIGDNRTSSVFCKVHKSQILGRIIF